VSKKEHVFATTIRLNTRTPEGSQTVAWLKSRDKKEYPSYSDLITEAVNFFCARRHALQNDPYLETRQKEDDFLRQIEERVEQAIRQAEARGFANALQMMQSGGSSAVVSQTQASLAQQNGSPQNMVVDDQSFDTAMDFISSL
jgi:hypothetical protein